MQTKAQARTAVREAIDDPNAKRWSDTALDSLISRTIDGLWSDVLDFAPWLLTQLEEPALTSPGYIDLRITTSGGQVSQRFFRVQKVTRGSREYQEARPQDVLMEDDSAIVAPDFTYAFYGNQLWMFPLDTAATVELRYNFLPTPFTSLADGNTVPWPDGFDDAYIYSAVRRGFAKGDAESIAQASSLAGEAMSKLEAAIRKQRIGPQVPNTYGSGIEFGGI